MKCDKLESFHHYEDMVITPATHMYRVYRADEVDAAIAELKSENKMLKEHIANGDVSRITWIDEATELKAENEQLKAKLENVQASAYADSVDAGMENRRLKRALWLARSYRGRDNSILLPSKFMRNVWDNVERKCLKKAEEYK